MLQKAQRDILVSSQYLQTLDTVPTRLRAVPLPLSPYSVFPAGSCSKRDLPYLLPIALASLQHNLALPSKKEMIPPPSSSFPSSSVLPPHCPFLSTGKWSVCLREEPAKENPSGLPMLFFFNGQIRIKPIIFTTCTSPDQVQKRVC